MVILIRGEERFKKKKTVYKLSDEECIIMILK